MPETDVARDLKAGAAAAARVAPKGPGGSTHKKTPGLLIFERVYYGSPRWNHQSERRKHTKDWYKKGHKQDLNREKDVVARINAAWDVDDEHAGTLRGEVGAPRRRVEIETCVNPRCEQRSQHVTRKAIDAYRALVEENLAGLGLPREKHDELLKPKCGGCGTRLVRMMIQELQNKWLYVLAGKGEAVRLQYEIHAQQTGNWLWLKAPKVAPRSERTEFEAGDSVIPAPKAGAAFHFFVSPVQLSRSALEKLLQHAGATRWIKEPYVDEQGGSRPAVPREFHQLADSTSRQEYVPVVDPFALAQEVNAWDYVPAVDAWYTFHLHKHEQLKRQIATILTAVVGKEDRYELTGQMNDDEGAWKTGKARHKAAAWLARHDECRAFLQSELNAAAERLIRWLDSAAHAIVETACLDERDLPVGRIAPLSLGVWHLAVVLQHMLACQPGADCMKRLRADASRIPRNIIDLTALTDETVRQRLLAETGGVAAMLLHWFAPVIAETLPLYAEPAALQTKYAYLGIPVKLDSAVEEGVRTGLAIDSDAIKMHEAVKDYRQRILDLAKDPAHATLKDRAESIVNADFVPERLLKSRLWKLNVALVDVAGTVEAIVDAKEAIQKPDQSLLDRVSMGAKVGAAGAAALGFGAKYLGQALGAQHAGLNEGLEKFSKVTGAVTNVLGAIEYITQAPEIAKAWKGSNKGVAAGQSLAWYGGGLSAIGGVVALASGLSTASAGAAAMAGPIGVGIAIVGAILIWYFSDDRNSLQLYAAHSVFGHEYGKGDDDDEPPKWTGGINYPDWTGGAVRYAVQLRILLRILGAFRVVINSRHYDDHQNTYFDRAGFTLDEVLSGGEERHSEKLPARATPYGGYVMLGYSLPSATLDVFVEGEYRKNDDPQAIIRPRTYVRVNLRHGTPEILDPQKHTFARASGDAGIFADARHITVDAVPPESWGTDKLQWVRVRIDQAVPSGYAAPAEKQQKWEFGARLDVSGQGHHLPDGGKYVQLRGNAGAERDPIPASSASV